MTVERARVPVAKSTSLASAKTTASVLDSDIHIASEVGDVLECAVLQLH